MAKKLEKRLLCLSELTDPEQVTETHLNEIYKLGSDACVIDACRSTCEMNTRCLNNLFAQDKVLANEEHSLKKQEAKSTYLGLRNLGSTCYLNSLIQCYYHMPELRRLIYNLDVADDHAANQLKLIFGQLQLSPEGPIDPSGLVAALNIIPAIQQDATEFHLLFMNCLEDRCHGILDLVQGTEVHETQCKVCGYLSQNTSKFAELDIRTNEKDLVDSLKNMLSEEVLEGSNQYHCPKCNKMRNGSRRTRLIQTPKYLNFHLMRFRMGAENVRIKVSSRVRFPDLLDMTPYVFPDVSSKAKRVNWFKYACFCIVLHIGDQATTGHYICLIRCREGSEEFWKVCNDECVFSIPLEDFDLSIFSTSIVSLNAYYSKWKKSPTRISKRVSLEKLEANSKNYLNNGYDCDVYHSSTTVYMVVYRLIEGEDKIGSPGDVQVPDSLWREIGAFNRKSILEKKKLEEEKVREKVLSKLRPDLRKSILFHLRATKSPKVLPSKRPKSILSGDTSSSDDDICLVPTRWLKKWIANPENLPPQLIYHPNESKIFARAGEATFNLKSFLCRHNRISPTNSLESIRAVSRSGLGTAFDWSVDYEACRVVHKETTDPCFLNAESADILSPCRKCIRQRVTDNRFTEECDAISKEMREWRRICKEATYPLDESLHDNRKIEDEYPIVYFVGTKSLAAWRSFAQNHYMQSLATMESVPTDFNKDAICAHGRLMKQFCRIVRPSIWNRIVSLFNPPFSAVTTNIDEYPSDKFKNVKCCDCEAVLKGLVTRAQIESRSMSALLNASESISSNRDLNELINDTGQTNPENMAIYLVPMEFIRKWRRFCRAPKISDVSNHLPSGFECSNVRCEHGRLRMPWDELISENFVFPLSSREWDLMSQSYPPSDAYPPMRLVQKKNGIKGTEEKSARLSFLFNPPNESFQVCIECHDEIQLQRLNFKNSRLYIRLCDSAEAAIDSDAAETATMQSIAEGGGLRRSARRRVNPDDICVHVDGSTSLLSLRSMLIENLRAYPSDQHFLVNGMELTENSKTIYQLGVRPDMVLFAWVDSSYGDESHVNAPPNLSANGNDIEIGFSGTRLMDF